jgi:hypothetical protein
MTEHALPTAWQEIDDTDHDAGRYNPRPISRFEHGETGAGIRLAPAGPNVGADGGTGTDGEGGYQVSVGADGPGDPGEMTALADAPDHADALGVAREFMATYNERCVENGEALDSVLADRDDGTA